jgi:hypothetical protein
MTDTTLHNLCKGFGALLSRSKVRYVHVHEHRWEPQVNSTVAANIVRGLHRMHRKYTVLLFYEKEHFERNAVLVYIVDMLLRRPLQFWCEPNKRALAYSSGDI